MHTIELDQPVEIVELARSPWQEPAVVFERALLAEAQGGPGPHGSPSGLLGPLASSGSTTTNSCL